MATPDEDRKARPNSFGDAAAATVNPAVTRPEMFNKTKPGTMLPTPPAERPQGFVTRNGGSQPMPPEQGAAMAAQNQAYVAGANAMSAPQREAERSAREGAMRSINAATASAQPSLGASIDTSPRYFDPATGRPNRPAAAQAPAAAPAAGFPSPASSPRPQSMTEVNGRASVPAAAQLAAQAPAASPAPMPASAKPAAQPLDAQAAADRAAIASAGKSAMGFLDTAGRAIADVATLVPRGVVGAYDSAVVRPMRAAGFNAAYLSPKLVPDGVDPASMTPFMDQKRMAQPQQPTQSATATNPAGPTSTTQPVGEPARNVPGNNQPNPAGAQSPSQNPDAPKQDPMTDKPVNNQVRVTRQPNGVLEFSGSNVSGDVTFTGNSGFKPSGFGVTVLPAETFGSAPASVQASLSNARQAAMQRGDLDAVARSLGEQGGRGVRGFAPTQTQIQAQPATPAASNDWNSRITRDNLLREATTKKNGESRADFATRSNAILKSMGYDVDERNNIRGNQTQQRGQDVGANTAAADRNSRERMEQGRQGIDAQRLGLDAERMADERTANGFKIRAAEQQEKLFTEWANAKTPEEKASAAERLRMLQGGQQPSAKDRYMVVGGGQQWDDKAMSMVNMPQQVFDAQSGQIVNLGGQSAPPASASGAAQRPVGTTSNVNGKVAVWDGKQWIPQ